jgi:geranylgeranyl reductase family protein
LTDRHATFFDAFIVGAGPAGSMLAYLLAKRGYQVAIIDKARFPREKVCGGGVSRKAIELIDSDISPVVHRTIRGAYLSFRNRSTLVKDVDPPVGVTVVRSEFDQFLLDRACAAGARFVAETVFLGATEGRNAIEVETSRGRYCSRLLFGADGVSSAVRSKLFGRKLVCYVPAMEALVPVNADILARLDNRAVFDFAGMPGGYGWIFPKRDHLNAGIYSPRGGKSLRTHLEQFMARYACLGRPENVRYLGFAIPVRNVSGEFQKGRAWLLGDAAGLAESVFGEGIYFALKSATLAANAVAESGFIATSMQYTQMLRHELLPELRASQWMGRMLYRFPKLAFDHWVLNNRINDDFAGLISGGTGYRQCLARTVGSPHKWLLPSTPPNYTLEL